MADTNQPLSIHGGLRLQDLPPSAARFCLNVERFCRKELAFRPEGCTIVAAVSGGADSLAMLLALFCLRERMKTDLVVAHLDHGLRPESADEAARVNAISLDLGLPYHSLKVDVAALARERSVGLEEAGRDARFSFLQDVLAEIPNGWLATGHQVNDLAEDQLMRLMRGSAWPALGGMPGIDARRRLLRPLLLCERTAIEQFLTVFSVTITEDASNLDRSFLRNRVRHDILPLFCNENPSFLQGAARRWQLARLDADQMAKETEAVLNNLSDLPWVVDKATLASFSKAGRLRLYRTLLDRLGPGEGEASMLLALDAAWEKGEGGKRFSFASKKIAELFRGAIHFNRL